ncbi:MAG: histidine phosphatase family protein [Clostridia bacterium]|nr:histidine phosphatase family protein [Clostridia bacterium]
MCFGGWENKRYAQLNGNAEYRARIDSGDELPFPNGEIRAQFAARCSTAFESIRRQTEACALIAHGGTIMAIMERYAMPRGTYFSFQAENGCGFILNGDGSYEAIEKT